MSDQPLPRLEPDENGSEDAESAENDVWALRTHRKPGWALLAGPGVSGGLWHRPRARLGDGSLMAVCGRTGRYVNDHEREIICCPACAADEPQI